MQAISELAHDLPLVLLVDDEPANLLALEAVLERMPLRTVRASTGEEALRILLKNEVAVVLLDVQMPRMDGFETAAQMKQHQRTAAIPIIFVTAISRDVEHVYKGYEHGAVDYVLKPFDPTILKAKIGVFIELFKRAETIKEQAKQLRERELEALDRKMERRYRRLADAMPLFVFATRLDGTVYYVNRAWTAHTGLSAEETSSVICRDVVHPDDVNRLTDAWQHAIASLLPMEAEMRVLRTSDSSYHWYLLRTTIERNDQGRVEGVIGTATNIDGQKQVEEARQRLLEQEQLARRAAETSNRVKDEFLANVSHELRTPLNAILGWAQLLRAGTLDATRQERAFEVIDRNAHAQAALVEDLLDVSSIASGKLRLRKKRFDAALVVHDAVETVRPSANSRGVELSFDCPPSVEMVADPERLAQVVWNLVANGVKFTARGGRVSVTLAPSDGKIRIVVTDTGAGISPEFLPFVFDRFRQADGSAAREKGGLGLGLAIVKHLVDLHSGTVVATSKGQGQGSSFTVDLPTRVNDAAEDEASESTSGITTFS